MVVHDAGTQLAHIVGGFSHRVLERSALAREDLGELSLQPCTGRHEDEFEDWAIAFRFLELVDNSNGFAFQTAVLAAFGACSKLFALVRPPLVCGR